MPWHHTDTDALHLLDSMTPLISNQDNPPPQDEVEYRNILSTALNPASIQQYRALGTFEPADLTRYTKPTASCRKVATVAGLPTLLKQHLITLSPKMRADVIKGLLGPFRPEDSVELIIQVLLNASRRKPLVNEGAQLPAYEDKDFAVAISYKHRDRTKIGGTLTVSDAQLLARAVLRIANSAKAEKVWVWFDQVLAINVPDIDESKWYRYGAIPYLVLPVLRYVNPSVSGKRVRPWLFFEESGAVLGFGFWSLGTGMLPQHTTDEYRYRPSSIEKNVLSPGQMVRWDSALMVILRYIYDSKDRLLEDYEYADTFKEFLSWITFITGIEAVPDSTRMPWYYLIERSLSFMLGTSREEIFRDSRKWSEEHLQLKEKILNEASMLFFPDGHEGDTMQPALTKSGSIALRLYDGTAITVEDRELRTIRPQTRSLSQMQLLASICTGRFFSPGVGPEATRIFNPTSGALVLLVEDIRDDLALLVRELAKVIRRSRAEIDMRAFRPGDWACYVSYLAMNERHWSVWSFPIRYMYRKKQKLLQLELFTRGILTCRPDFLFQVKKVWERNAGRFEARRICSSAQICRYREVVGHDKNCAIRYPRKLPRAVIGVRYNGDSDSKKAMLGMLKPQEVPKDLSCYSLVAGTKDAEGDVDVCDMDLRETGAETEYVCAVNSLRCVVTPSSDPRCRWHVSWGDLYTESVRALPRATIQGRVGATLRPMKHFPNAPHCGSPQGLSPT